jgi:hypothetical protein
MISWDVCVLLTCCCSLQAQLFASLDHAEMGLWDALQRMGELREYEAALLADAGQGGHLDPDMPLLEHAFQTAEICRCAHAACCAECREVMLFPVWLRIEGCCAVQLVLDSPRTAHP